MSLKPSSLLSFRNNAYVCKVSKPLPENDYGHTFEEKAIVRTSKRPFKTSLLYCKKCFLRFEFSYDLCTLDLALKEAKVPPCGNSVDVCKVYKRPNVLEERRRFDLDNPGWWDTGCEVTDDDYIEVMKYLGKYDDEDIERLEIYDESKSMEKWLEKDEGC